MKRQKLTVIAGPTASGKTACAVEYCRLRGGEVVSADSMQIYRGMEILTASPTAEEMGGIPHHMLNIADPREKYSAARYAQAAHAVIDEICARGAHPVLCGGTGLYIDAATRPMRFSERCDEALRRELIEMAAAPGGRQRLHAMLREIDPEAAERLHENDVRRVTRALEIYRLTGRTQTEQARIDMARPDLYDVALFALSWPREALYARIDRRVDEMIDRGLIREVERLHADAKTYPTAEQAIGYKEIVDALNGRCTMDEAVRRVKQVSRNYAKRQVTWLQRDRRTVWLQAQGRSAQALAIQMLELEEERNQCPK